MKMRSFRLAMLVAFMVVAAPLAAFAHAKMVTSTPKDGATVAAGLSDIELAFSKPMRLTLLHVRQAKDKQDVPLRGALPKTFEKTAKVAVEALKAGAYDISWTAVSEDGHVMTGSFAFTVADTPGTAQ
jgi:methionine-rich copper-binding protein CopC